MLKIQEFIMQHEDWRELLSAAPYNLKISEDDGFVLFKYNQINSDFSQEICKEARGLILDMQDNFRVVRYAFKKFFNIDEGYAANIDWDSAVASEKIDGSIMSVWYARGKWHLSTNGTIDAFKAEIAGVGPYKTFGDLFESVLPLSAFVGNRWENLCLTFELVSPYNKVVIDYPETKLYLLTARYMHTLEEIDDYGLDCFAKELNVARPERYTLSNEADYRKLVEDMPEGHEGIVVDDCNGERVKIKTLLYFEMHKAKNNGVITLERIVDLIRANDHHEFLSYFPEYTDMFNDIQRQIRHADTVVEKVKQDVAQWKLDNKDIYETSPRTARKWFAQDIVKNKHLALYFSEYDGKLDIQKFSASRFIGEFDVELKED